MRKRIALISIAGVAFIASHASAAQSSGLCAAAVKAVPIATECRETAGGVVIGKNAADVEAVARAAAEGERKFQAFFNRPVPRYAVSFFVGNDTVSKALRAADFGVVQPWFDPEAKSAAMDQSVRRAVLKAAEGKNLDTAQIEAMVAQAKAKMPQVSAATAAATDAGAVAHELGHQWFIKSFSTGQAVGNLGHYGGPAPDWLDELAAVLHENDELTANRRLQFEEIYRQLPDRKALPDTTRDDLIDLQKYLSREHPANKSVREALSKIRQANGGKQKSGGMTILAGAEALAVSRDGLIFYLQSRAFADFMIERSGSPHIFAEIAAADANGVTFPRWLAESGRTYKLVGTVPLLEKQWQTWLKAKYVTDRKTSVKIPSRSLVD